MVIKKVYSDLENAPILVNWETANPVYSANAEIFEDGKQRIVSITDNKYIYSEKIGNSDLCKTLIAIRNKKTNKVIFHEVNLATVSVAKAKVNIKQETADSKPSRQENLQRVNKLFGTKKAKRLTEIRERLKTDIKTVQQHLESTIQDVDKEKNEDELDVLNKSKNVELSIIPFNRDAQNVEDVYDINDFITQNELHEYKRQAKTILKKGYDDINCTNNYIKEEIARIQGDSCKLEQSLKKQRISLLLYADDLIKFITTKGTKGIRTFKVGSPLITEKIFKLFSVRQLNKVSRPISLKDKCTCHILAILFIVSERYLIDLEYISSSVKISNKKLSQLCNVIGAQPVAKSKTLYQIRVPIPKLKSIFARKHGRK